MVTTIRLQNFRSYKDESFEFDPAVNIVVGPNASGKTNLLEAILALSSGSSYRARDHELIAHGKPWARLEGFYGAETRALKLNRLSESAEKSFQVGDKAYKRLSLECTVPIVFFEPNHLHIITRGPEQRREYVDGLLERTAVGYKTLLGNYRRALAQRNALLKRGHSFGQSQLFAWNVRLSELGAKIVQARQGLIDEINKSIGQTYSEIAQHKSAVTLKYETHFPIDRYASQMLSKLEKNASLDYERGFTAYGPHREDIIFLLNTRPTNQTASRGETRSLLLGLKVFELSLIEKARGQKPVLLLDDVFSELDGARRHALVDHLKAHQTIITTTDADGVVKYFTGNSNILALTKNS